MRGFTMVEMLVSLGIILIITSIVLLGQNSFNKNLVLVDTAYTVAFTLRQAQTLALSSRKVGTIQNAGYGTHFANGSMIPFPVRLVMVSQGSVRGTQRLQGLSLAQATVYTTIQPK